MGRRGRGSRRGGAGRIRGAGAPRQVFVDASGRRRKLVRYGVAAASAAFAGYVVILVAGLFGAGPADDALPWVQNKPEPLPSASAAPSRSTPPPRPHTSPADRPTASPSASEHPSASAAKTREAGAGSTTSASPSPTRTTPPGATRGANGNGTTPPGRGGGHR